MPYLESAERLNRSFFWYSAARGSTIHQDFPVTTNQALIGGLLASEAEIFLMCHEIAHGLIAEGAQVEGGLIEELSEGLWDIPEDWREELMADRLALLLSIGRTDGKRDTNKLAMQYAGWEFALLLHREWERYEATVNNRPVWSDTHPPAGRRIDNLRGTVRRLTGNSVSERILSYSEALSTVFCNLVDTIFSDEFQSALVTRDEARVARLTQLAADCDAGLIPDYARFTPEAAEILLEAESWTLLQLVDEATAAIRGESEINRSNFGIAKLVWRTCEELPEPIYSVVKKVTALPDLK